MAKHGCIHAQLALLVVRFLGWIIILCIIGSLLQKVTGSTPPEWFKDISLVAMGALGMVLSRPGQSDSVTIDNPRSDPVPTMPVDKDDVDGT